MPTPPLYLNAQLVLSEVGGLKYASLKFRVCVDFVFHRKRGPGTVDADVVNLVPPH